MYASLFCIQYNILNMDTIVYNSYGKIEKKNAAS